MNKLKNLSGSIWNFLSRLFSRISLNYLGAMSCMSMLLILTSCGRDDDTVVLIDQEEFNSGERRRMSAFLEESIKENTNFTVMNPLATSEVASFYEYLDRNYQTLVNTDKVTNRAKLRWSIHILKDDESKNTFITPGGVMYITTGMLKTIKTEHELINILAHEISYADGDVLLNKLKTDYGGDVLFEVIAGQYPPELSLMAEELQNIAYSESEVLEADSYAIDIICDFLYDPHGMRDFLKRVIANEDNLEWMKNRPSSEDRPILVEQSASGCGPGSTYESRYQEFLAKLP